jgi:aspartate/methionine/tyrosine aminotransferase
VTARDYPLGAFLERWYPVTRHELAASESETWQVAELLQMARPEDLARWDGLSLGYTDPCGAGWLRHSIAESYAGIGLDQVIAFAGAQEALAMALQALVGPGDHAIMVLPAYQPSERALTALCETTGLALDPSRGWALDLDRLERTIRPNTRLVLANIPNNPTGKLISPQDFAALIALCERHGLWLVNDEVYRLIDRDPTRRLPCVADCYARGVSIDAMSKGFGLPGLRVGWMACRDPGLLRRVARLKQTASMCLSGPSEVLAQIALGVRHHLLARNRAIATANLAGLDRFMAQHAELFDWHRPEAGVVGYVRYRGPDGVERFTSRMARQAGVLVLPSSVWRSALADLPEDRFRIGFGRRGCAEALAALAAALTADTKTPGSKAPRRVSAQIQAG